MAETLQRVISEHRFNEMLSIPDEEPTLMIGAGGASRGHEIASCS